MYQPFMVAPLKAGISKYLKPWMETEDAMTDMQDCYTYRGSIYRRDGYTFYDQFPNSSGIYYVDIGDGTTTTFSGTLPYVGGGNNVGKISLNLSFWYDPGTNTFVSGVTDDGAGAITGTNIAALSTITYATGAFTINFTIAPTAGFPIYLSYGVRLAIGDGTAGPYAVSIPITGNYTGPVHLRSVFVAASTAPQQTSNSPFETPAADGLTGDLTNTGAAPKVTAGTITYATGAITGLTFTNAVAAGNDIWARWEFLNG